MSSVWSCAMTPVPPKPDLSLALQGGGAFGAFTWGVLDRLLDEAGPSLDAVSGASAGAVNAVLLAEGLRTGGREGARALLEGFWTRLASEAATSFMPSGARLGFALDLSSRLLSPYQLNPFNLNPLRSILSDLVDFAALREAPPLRLLVSATRVGDGQTRLFGETEISLDAVLASACLPTIHQGVEIDGETYWDGGYAANPPLLPLVEASRADRVLLVQIVPTTGEEHPTTSSGISRRLNQITFNAPLQHELDTLARLQEIAAGSSTPDARHLRNTSVERISAEDWYPDLASRSATDLGRSLVFGLRDAGRSAAEAWLGG